MTISDPNDVYDATGVRFGRTEVLVAVGDLLDQNAEGIVFPANQRGVMGAITTPGLASLRSLGGSEIEREAMIQGPLELGTAIVTNAPGLESRGVIKVIHAVVQRSLGEPVRIEHIRRAASAALIAANQARVRTLAIPLLGVDSSAGRANPGTFVNPLIEETVAALRRSTLRLDRVIIVCRFQDHAKLALEALIQARQRSWTRSSD